MDRLEQLRGYMETQGLDAYYSAKPANVSWVSGYTGEDSFLFITKKNQYFITDARYTEQASYECPDYTIVNWRTANGYDMGKTLQQFVQKEEIKYIGFEADYLTYDKWNTIQSACGVELVPTSNVIEGYRSVKTPEELRCIRASCEIACRAFEKIIQDIRPGVTEKELASRLSHYMVMEGADTKPYGGILISGAKTSLLHGIPDNKVIEYGDFVLMDYGCQYKGYLSDMTRTVVVGKADAKQREVYNLCRRMTEDTEKVVRPGVTGISCYETSLEAIKDTEYLQYHYPQIGHGVGVFVHELPRIGEGCGNVLQENQILTVEPGIYIPGWGGVRIEDQGLITQEGYENLTNTTHELIEL